MIYLELFSVGDKGKTCLSQWENGRFLTVAGVGLGAIHSDYGIIMRSKMTSFHNGEVPTVLFTSRDRVYLSRKYHVVHEARFRRRLLAPTGTTYYLVESQLRKSDRN